MSFTLSDFQTLRPYLYHLTDQRNIARIQRTARLTSAARILQAAGERGVISSRRPTSIDVPVDGERVWIRDQRPLHAGNVRLEGGWTFGTLVSELNEKVFFWPGGPSGPISYGHRHFARYESEHPALLRLNTARMIATNPAATPLFSRYNSGSPRWSNGIASPRGPRTFLSCTEATFSPAAVVECVIPHEVMLPECAEIAPTYAGPWQRLL